MPPFLSALSASKVVQMLIHLIFFAVLIYSSSNSNVACAVENDHHRQEREFSILAPIHNLISNIKEFFGDKTRAIEENRQRMKSAFKLFISELSRRRKPSTPGLPLPEGEKDLELHSGPKLRNFSRIGYNQKVPFVINAEMNAEQMITAAGYKSESHTVLTADGYLLTMHRVHSTVDKVNKRVVLLHHGLLGSSEDWLYLGHERALPYMLIDNGYDVWLLNARGNRYSKTHTVKNAKRLDFWEFSWHEMGVYDLPAAIKYISELTKRAEINFIGHSMGATALLVLLSTAPEYNYFLRSGILLAPLAFMYHSKGPIRMLANFYRRNGHQSLRFLGQTNFMDDEVFPEQIINKYCKGDQRACLNPLLLLADGGKDLNDEKLMNNILAHVPAGGSVKTVLHYVQLAKSGYFQMYDYGAANNFRKYGNSTPFLYNLRQISLPLAFFSSPYDWLATIPDIQTMLPLLQDVSVHHVVKAENFGHFDFVWSPNAPELVFNFILSILDQISPKQEPFFLNVK